MDEQAVYRIVVRGELSRRWIDWFDSLTIDIAEVPEGTVTTLVGPVADQAALRGMLCKLWDLNMTVLSVARLATSEV